MNIVVTQLLHKENIKVGRVCLYAMLLLLNGLHLGGQTFRGSSPTSRSGRHSLFFLIHPAITLSMNNRITLCSYYAQLSTNIYVQLLTTSKSFLTSHKGKASVDVIITDSIMSRFREILSGSTKYQGVDGYFCDNVF